MSNSEFKVTSVGSNNQAQSPKNTVNEGLRFNADKLRVDLVPPEWIVELARVSTAGSFKYLPKNWLNGMEWDKIYSSMMRHTLLWQMGQDVDADTKCSHLAMVAWNALALLSYQIRGIGEDKRDFMPYDANFNFIEDSFGDTVGIGLTPEEMQNMKTKYAHLRGEK